ncbi:hypothetical protein CANCADRAFT_72455 [Tortispora caseinolytica NRRL Y-17796]|uniref:Eukaryotic translation initiation factor 3 subunit C n=1 Tax=Tortispora caseinolytica NRRL Y-17796 TaxID=767744 RepID=A0A1E4TIG4_9ASCO|nr:hypothetical protein CANCADRAFT_72455 [Tortispora caseinolytica NRRL Y-17796]
MSSRFFAAGYSDSDLSSSDEELDSEFESEQSSDSGIDFSEDDEDASDYEQQPQEDRPNLSNVPSRFLRTAGSDSDSDSSDDDSRRVVKSAKTKRLEEVQEIVESIETAKMVNEWSIILTEFDKLIRLVTRHAAQDGLYPAFIQCISELDEDAKEAAKSDDRKSMNATLAKALNTIRNRLKKVMRTYESEIEKYRKDPDGYLNGTAATSTPQPEQTAQQQQHQPIDDEGFTVVSKDGKAKAITTEYVLQTLRTVIESRGKRNIDRAAQIKTLEDLRSKVGSAYQRIRVLQVLIACRFDMINVTANYMPIAPWKTAVTELGELLGELENAPHIVVAEGVEAYDDDSKDPEPNENGIVFINGSVTSFIERLDDEFTKSLQYIDPHSTEYVERLKDEPSLYQLLIRGQLYIESVNQSKNLYGLLVRRLEHIYFKSEEIVKPYEVAAWSKIPEGGRFGDSKITPRIFDSSKFVLHELIKQLCAPLYEQDDNVLRTKAMLFQVYSYALHNHYYKVRTLFLMSHVQSSISNADVGVQVLYNRTLVQIGFCAFRKGLIAEAQQCLQEVCGSGRTKELLAQGSLIQRYPQNAGEPETVDTQRFIPFHMHINLELLECVYLTSSMIIETPILAAAGSNTDNKRKPLISRPFRRLLDHHDRQVFVGPPENMRDYVMQAAKALASGDWRKSKDFICAIKIWDLMPESEKIKEMLGTKLQEEGLRTYIFTYASLYEAITLDTLATLFDLSVSKVTSIISKVIYDDEIAAALDQQTNSLIFRKGFEVTPLQSFALALADKAAQLSDLNERQTQQSQGGRYDRDDKRGNYRAGNQRARTVKA